MSTTFTIQPFGLAQWPALWTIRRRQLAEHGIQLAPAALPAGPQPVGRQAYEWDYHHIEEVYLRGPGGFWLAWVAEKPAGHIGAQDLGGLLELRRMYVVPEQRGQGIGAGLVQMLLAHAQQVGVQAVELWTARDGPGRRLYARMGFRAIDRPGLEYGDLAERTNFVPGADEIRMRLDF